MESQTASQGGIILSPEDPQALFATTHHAGSITKWGSVASDIGTIEEEA
jgi:hypothetical protein